MPPWDGLFPLYASRDGLFPLYASLGGLFPPWYERGITTRVYLRVMRGLPPGYTLGLEPLPELSTLMSERRVMGPGAGLEEKD